MKHKLNIHQKGMAEIESLRNIFNQAQDIENDGSLSEIGVNPCKVQRNSRENHNRHHNTIGFTNLESEICVDQLLIEGKLPDWLSGTLIRNGPAKFHLSRQSLNHWFDGLAMLHRFSFKNGTVSYANKFIRSNAFKESIQKGKIAYREFATDPCRSIFSKVSSLFSFHATDNTNVNVSKLDNKFIALTETPISIEFDPVTLETLGVVDYRDKIKGSLTTAHPHYDHEKDETFNYLTAFSRNSKYNIYGKSRGKDRGIVASIEAKEPSYMHSFGLSENYLILTEFPLKVNPIDMLLSGKPFIENFKWQPEKGTKFILINRSDGKVIGTYSCEPFFAFHHVNAFEVDNKIIVDIIAYHDNSIINSFYLDKLKEDNPTTMPKSEYRRYTIDPSRNKVSYEVIHAGLELPRINYKFNMKEYSYLYAVGMGSTANFTDSLIKISVQGKDFATWSEKDCQPGEPVFVSRPGSKEEDDGVILSVVLDSAQERSFLLVLDAHSFKEIARAQVPLHIPFGIHGQYYGNTE
jgi:beta,beta-carotene 9',10'-dioxygenase